MRILLLPIVVGHWSSWSQWSSCSECDGNGLRSRHRKCLESDTCPEKDFLDTDISNCEVEKIGCDSIPYIQNGNFFCSKLFAHDSTCTFTCKPGFEIIGDDKTTCFDGVWFGTVPTCEENKPISKRCKKYNAGKNSKMICSMNDGHEECLVSCKNGYYFQSYHSGFIKCINGTWSENIPKCIKEQKCPDNSHFMTCLPDCREGCNGDCIDGAVKDNACRSGCNCDKGFVWLNEKCVALEDCGCKMFDKNFLFGEGYYLRKCERYCTCEKSGWTCDDSSGCEDVCMKTDRGRQCVRRGK